MKLLQYSLRTFLVVVALVATYFPCHRIYRSWLANNYGSFYVDTVRNSYLRNGDTLQEVVRHFDKMQMVTDLNAAQMKEIVEGWAGMKLTILEDDQFFHASLLNGAGMDLQFRDGQLVNLWKKAAKVNQHPLMRSLFPIYYLSLVTLLFFAYRLRVRRTFRPETNSKSIDAELANYCNARE